MLNTIALKVSNHGIMHIMQNNYNEDVYIKRLDKTKKCKFRALIFRNLPCCGLFCAQILQHRDAARHEKAHARLRPECCSYSAGYKARKKKSRRI